MKFIFLILSVFALTSQAAGYHYHERCGHFFRYLDESVSGHFEVRDDPFYVSAEVMPNEKNYLGAPIPGQRTLDPSFYLRTREGRSTALSGKTQFQRMLKHFEGEFDQILGQFKAPQEGELSDILEQFNQLTGGESRMSPEEAALKIWFGERAAEAGYGSIEVKELKGSPGAFTSVTILYRKKSQ